MTGIRGNDKGRKREYRGSIALRTISGIVLLLIVFALVIGYIGIRRFSDAILEQYSRDGLLTAETAANIIDGDDLHRLRLSNGDTAEYRKVYNELQSLCNSSDSAFIYVIQPDTFDYNHIRFLFSTINYNSDFKQYEFGYIRKTTNDEYKRKYRMLYEGSSHQEIVVRDKGYIETDKHITAMVPIRGSDNTVKAILCVQRQLDVLAKARAEFVRSILTVLIMLLTLVILGQSLYLHATLIDPLHKITNEAQRFAVENIRTGKKLSESIRTRDEIGQLAGSIDQMEERIQDYVEDITRITAERERIGAELTLAARIQENVLPNEFPAFPGRNEFDIYASMKPAKEIGGDFYDYYLVNDDQLAVVMADVAGKGIPAALFMMACKLIIKNYAMTGLSPAGILEAANDQISSGNHEEMFVTVWLGILDLKTGIMTAANAGHEYPVLKKPDGEFELLKDQHGFVIGAMEGMTYTDYEIDMRSGAKLFLYTDGLPEAQAADKSFFGIERTIEVLNLHKDASPADLLKEMSAAAGEFKSDAPQFDDLTMLCIESMIG